MVGIPGPRQVRKTTLAKAIKSSRQLSVMNLSISHAEPIGLNMVLVRHYFP